MLEVWGAPWLAKVGSQERIWQDRSVKDSLLREGTAGKREVSVLFPEEWAVTGSVPKSKCWVVILGPPRMELSEQQASCPSVLPNIHTGKSQHPSTLCMGGVLPCSFWPGGKKHDKQDLKPVSLWKAAKSSKFAWLACNEMLCWQVCAQLMKCSVLAGQLWRMCRWPAIRTADRDARNRVLPPGGAAITKTDSWRTLQGLTTPRDIVICDTGICQTAENHLYLGRKRRGEVNIETLTSICLNFWSLFLMFCCVF